MQRLSSEKASTASVKQWVFTGMGAWPGILAESIRWWIKSCPIKVPGTAAVQTIQGHDGLGVLAVPASAAAFEALRGRFTLGFRGAAANLPAALPELGKANHGPPFRDIAH
jgi:hypothetical protein